MRREPSRAAKLPIENGVWVNRRDLNEKSKQASAEAQGSTLRVRGLLLHDLQHDDRDDRADNEEGETPSAEEVNGMDHMNGQRKERRRVLRTCICRINGGVSGR